MLKFIRVSFKTKGKIKAGWKADILTLTPDHNKSGVNDIKLVAYADCEVVEVAKNSKGLKCIVDSERYI